MEFTYFQAILIGLIQGITELFPISSLGHAVLIPGWIGGSWSSFTTDPNSPYLAVTVALHAASAIVKNVTKPPRTSRPSVEPRSDILK